MLGSETFRGQRETGTHLTEQLFLIPEEPDPVDVNVDGNLWCVAGNQHGMSFRWGMGAGVAGTKQLSNPQLPGH